jgi:hypothetical protein
MGRRAEGLETIRAAAAIRPGLELRNEALACWLSSAFTGHPLKAQRKVSPLYDSIPKQQLGIIRVYLCPSAV